MTCWEGRGGGGWVRSTVLICFFFTVLTRWRVGVKVTYAVTMLVRLCVCIYLCVFEVCSQVVPQPLLTTAIMSCYAQKGFQTILYLYHLYNEMCVWPFSGDKMSDVQMTARCLVVQRCMPRPRLDTCTKPSLFHHVIFQLYILALEKTIRSLEDSVYVVKYCSCLQVLFNKCPV